MRLLLTIGVGLVVMALIALPFVAAKVGPAYVLGLVLLVLLAVLIGGPIVDMLEEESRDE